MNPSGISDYEYLCSPSEEVRYEAWSRLFFSEDSEDQHRLELIANSRESILKIYLARFLAGRSEPVATQWVCRLLRDEDTRVFEAARKSFLKLKDFDRHKQLAELLEDTRPSVRNFAIETICQARALDMIPKLIKLLRQGDESVQLVVLTALRHLPDKRLAPVLLAFSTHPDANFRFKTVLVYGALHESGVPGCRGILLKFLKDDSPRVRQIVLWVLRRHYSWWNRRWFLDQLNDEINPEIRKEALSGLAAFSDKATISKVLDVMVNEKNSLVALKAEEVLLSYPPKKLLRGLYHSLKYATSPAKHHRTIKLIALFKRGQDDVLHYLLRGMAKMKKPLDRVAFIEALGILEHRGALPHLEKFLSDQPLLAYAALRSILNIWRYDPDFPLIGYLKKLSQTPPLMQMLLRHLQRYTLSSRLPEKTQIELVKYLNDDNVNVRYLALLCLVDAERPDILIEVIKTAEQDSFIELRQSLLERLGSVFSRNTELFSALIKKSMTNESVCRAAWKICLSCGIATNRLRKILLEMFHESVFFHHEVNAAFMGQAFAKVLCEAGDFPDEIWRKLFSESLEHPAFLVSLANHLLQKNQEVDIPVAEIISSMDSSPCPDLYFALLQRASGHESITALAALACREKYAQWHDKIATILRNKISRGAA